VPSIKKGKANPGNISQNTPSKDEFELKDKFDASGKF
jgi:hypothetical protein